MGGGSYSTTSYVSSTRSKGYDRKPVHEVFTQRMVHKDMNPAGVTLREARDSEEHPESVPIIIALDVTGSMGYIPHHLIKEGLPTIMDTIINAGIQDPQVMFLAIGDHECDEAPLQISQFESSDQMIQHWLERVYLERGGGGNDGESYHLAWYFAANHTAIDAFEKRGEKGFLFTIGDEPVLHNLPGQTLNKIMGGGQHKDTSAAELLEKAREKYNVHHLHMREGQNGRDPKVMGGWKEIIGENMHIVDRKEDVAKLIGQLVVEGVRNQCKQALIPAKTQYQPDDEAIEVEEML